MRNSLRLSQLGAWRFNNVHQPMSTITPPLHTPSCVVMSSTPVCSQSSLCHKGFVYNSKELQKDGI